MREPDALFRRVVCLGALAAAAGHRLGAMGAGLGAVLDAGLSSGDAWSGALVVVAVSVCPVTGRWTAYDATGTLQNTASAVNRWPRPPSRHPRTRMRPSWRWL
jgi:hypothetical protein